jgi:hypothetical protein
LSALESRPAFGRAERELSEEIVPREEMRLRRFEGVRHDNGHGICIPFGRVFFPSDIENSISSRTLLLP